MTKYPERVFYIKISYTQHITKYQGCRFIFRYVANKEKGKGDKMTTIFCLNIKVILKLTHAENIV